ncbi:MAG: FHA domain-containing protein [Roseiflexus sp.]
MSISEVVTYDKIRCYNRNSAPARNVFLDKDVDAARGSIAMTTRQALAQEIADTQRTISGLTEEIAATRNYIATQEQALQSQPPSLRAITEEGLAKARANLVRKEAELQIAQQTLANTQRTLAKVEEIGRKQDEIRKLEQDLATINALLERARSEHARLETELLTMTGPAVVPPFALILGDGRTVPLPTDRAEVLIGCQDPADHIFPDVDLSSFDARSAGVSRRHALLRYADERWTITDLGSANGTFVNDVALTPQTPVALPDGAIVRLGAFVVTFRSISQSKTVRL